MKVLTAEIYLALLFLTVLPEVARPAEIPLVPGGVELKADTISHDKDKEIFQATGNVKVKWDGFTLLSDSVLVRQEEDEAVAEGKVILRKEGVELKSDRIRVNYVTQQGEAEHGDLFVKQRNFHVRGDRFIKTGDNDYRLERATFTTCDGDSPSWKFTAQDLDVTIEDYASGRNAVFYVGEMPLFYTPYILFPVKRERQSGFLFPRFGNSTIKGLYLDIPYYLAISPSQEATLDLDGQTKRGAGLGFDYRYMRPHGSSGDAKGYIIYDTNRDWVRGNLTLKQREFFSPSLTLTSDLNFALDRDFYRDYGEVSGDYNRQLLDSVMFLTKNWTQSSLVTEARYVQDLTAATNEQTMQKLPAIAFTKTGSPIGSTPLFFKFDSSLINFYREVGPRGQRLDLHPTLSLYRTFSPGFDLSVWGGYLQRLYGGLGSDEKAKGDYHGDGLFDGGISLSAPLARVYGTGRSDVIAVRHALVPELQYSVIQQKNQERLPVFDYGDRIVGQQMLTWSLVNYVTGKYADPAGSSTYSDILYLRLSQGYQLSGNRRDLLTLVDEGRRFTDIRLEARYALAKLLTVTADTRYNPYMTRFSTASLVFALDDGKGDLASLGYQYAHDQVRYLEGKATLPLVKPLVFNYTCRYSFDRGNFLESLFSLEYKRQCWSVIFSYQDRLLNRSFMINFTLAGVGGFAPVRAL
ncbi:MAG TPA: LPS assembly protein LptD [Geobacteraceae bacterium]|nr:LPS assembly protein LptD [Geobacteraceae bacterium]